LGRDLNEAKDTCFLFLVWDGEDDLLKTTASTAAANKPFHLTQALAPCGHSGQRR
jgi:hypothetical protein